MSNLPQITQRVKNNRLSLTSGARIRKRKFAPPAAPEPVLHIGRNISLAMTLAEYEVTPNAATLAKIGGE